MTAMIQSLETPDGAFTLLVDERQRVLASGWTADPAAILGRLRMPPSDVREGSVDAAAAVTAYYAATSARSTMSRCTRPAPRCSARVGGAPPHRARPPLTYAEFAAALGSPSAVRAAASICARNAAALFVPCHRVLRTGGALGGFAWGLPVKQALLDREAALAR
jgi:methylated-DNA-[protein]-cysteine S-methyltransferase